MDVQRIGAKLHGEETRCFGHAYGNSIGSFRRETLYFLLFLFFTIEISYILISKVYVLSSQTDRSKH